MQSSMRSFLAPVTRSGRPKKKKTQKRQGGGRPKKQKLLVAEAAAEKAAINCKAAIKVRAMYR